MGFEWSFFMLTRHTKKPPPADHVTSRPKIMNNRYTDIEESLLRQCGMLLGPIFQQCAAQVRADTHLTANATIIQVTSKLYSTLAAVSVDTEEPDKFSLKKTLQALQAQTQIFAERVTRGAAQVCGS